MGLSRLKKCESLLMYKRYLLWVVIFFLAILLPVGVLNYLMDPLWTFGHSLPINNMQYGVNERLQKTNKFYFEGKRYDALLLGSSRSTGIDQHAFEGLRVFNFAFSGAKPAEYEAYLDFAKRENGGDFEVVFVGLDFRDTNGRDALRKDPQAIFRQTKSLLYRYRLLVSTDTLKLSLVNLKRYLTGQTNNRSYTRTNVVRMNKLAEETVERIVRSRDCGFEEYCYDEGLVETFKRMRANNPDTKFAAFTTPVSSHLLELYLREGRRADYCRWLGEMVETFGEVYHFMDRNSVTVNYRRYFSDSNHFYPEVGGYIAARVCDTESKDIPADFGIKLDGENTGVYLAGLDDEQEKRFADTGISRSY